MVLPGYDARMSFVIGDSVSFTVPVGGVPVGDPIAQGFLTYKRAPLDADPGLVQKKVTTTNAPGTGQVLDTGTGTVSGQVGVGLLRFDLTPTDTLLFAPGGEYLYDAQYKTAAGIIKTPVQGVASPTAQTTVATT
jgi:hypothetical protein